jgi:molecular chaperone DnaK
MTISIGIDLGTTISVVAHVAEDGTVRVLENDAGQELTPSVVHFEENGTVVVGSEAKAAAALQPDRVVAAIKRQIGTDLVLDFDGVAYRPEGISALVLRSLIESAARSLGTSVTELAAVVTVPAYFGTAEREATAAAAGIAGLQLLDLVAEPVAAALSYGVTTASSGTVVVYDLGGGTFDATVIELGSGVPRVVAVDGAPRLGGINFDETLGALLLERFARAADDDDAVDDEDFVLQLHAEAENVKKRLSRKTFVSVPLRRAESGRTAQVSVSRDEFQQRTEGLVRESIEVVERVIATARARGARAPEQILLTGGSSRMPAVAESLSARFGVPIRLSDPDTAVAKGAAVHANALSTASSSLERGLLPPSGTTASRILAASPAKTVLPRAIGVKIHDSSDEAAERSVVQHVVAANTPLPVRAARATFATVVRGQERIRVELMEQAGAVPSPDPRFNRRIVDGELVGLTEGLPAGSAIDFDIAIDSGGRVSFSAVERASGRPLRLESYMEGVVDAVEAAEQRRAVSNLMIRE